MCEKSFSVHFEIIALRLGRFAVTIKKDHKLHTLASKYGLQEDSLPGVVTLRLFPVAVPISCVRCWLSLEMFLFLDYNTQKPQPT